MFSSARSLVLQNPYLLNLVFEFCGNLAGHELLWASLTCKAFLGPALNVLWEVVFGLGHLLIILPSFDVKKIWNHEASHSSETIVLDQDLDRVRCYSRRIRKLLVRSYSPKHLDNIMFGLFNRLEESGATSFRSLQHLAIHPGCVDKLSHNDLSGFMAHCASSMVCLLSLAVDFSPKAPKPVALRRAQNLTPIKFSLLGKLMMTGYAHDVRNVLNVLLVPNLVHLYVDIRLDDEEDITDLDPFVLQFSKLNEQHLHQIKSLKICTDTLRCSIGGYLHPLKAFTGLSVLDIEFHSCCDHILTPTLASVLVDRSWSYLRAIDFDFGLSIEALPIIASSFPKLQELDFNLDQTPANLKMIHTTHEPHGLETLAIKCLPNDFKLKSKRYMLDDLAEFIHRLFPQLKILKAPEGLGYALQIAGPLNVSDRWLAYKSKHYFIGDSGGSTYEFLRPWVPGGCLLGP